MQYNNTEIEQTFASLNLGVTTFVINALTNLEAALFKKDEELKAAVLEIQRLEEEYGPENELPEDKK